MVIDYEFVDTECLSVEKQFSAQTGRGIQGAVDVLGVRRYVYTKFLNHALSNRTVGGGAFDGEGTAKAQAEGVVQAELVALGVAPEVVVVVEDEDAGLATGGLAVEMRGREAADAPSNDDEVIGLTRLFGLTGGIPKGAIAKAVSNVERSGMAAA